MCTTRSCRPGCVGIKTDPYPTTVSRPMSSTRNTCVEFGRQKGRGRVLLSGCKAGTTLGLAATGTYHIIFRVDSSVLSLFSVVSQEKFLLYPRSCLTLRCCSVNTAIKKMCFYTVCIQQTTEKRDGTRRTLCCPHA